MKTTFMLSCVMALLSTQTANAQDEQAKKLLDDLSNKTKSYSTLTASFSFILDDKVADIQQKQEGTIRMKGDKFSLDMGVHKVISDGKSRYTYNKETNEVYIDALADLEDEGALNPAKLFTIWESGFKHFYNNTVTEGVQTLEVVKLVPTKPEDKSFHTIKLYIDKAKMQLAKIEILGKDGDNYTYKVKSLEPNKPYSDADFAFDKAKYPGVEVIDNR
jgi:outer membrane lipoprotein-sorting protein